MKFASRHCLPEKNEYNKTKKLQTCNFCLAYRPDRAAPVRQAVKGCESFVKQRERRGSKAHRPPIGQSLETVSFRNFHGASSRIYCQLFHGASARRGWPAGPVNAWPVSSLRSGGFSIGWRTDCSSAICALWPASASASPRASGGRPPGARRLPAPPSAVHSQALLLPVLAVKRHRKAARQPGQPGPAVAAAFVLLFTVRYWSG